MNNRITSLLCWGIISGLVLTPIIGMPLIESNSKTSPIMNASFQTSSTLSKSSTPVTLLVETHHQPLCTFEITNVEDQAKLIELINKHPSTEIPTEFIIGQSFTIYSKTETLESSYTFNSQRLVISIKNISNSHVDKKSYKIDTLYYDEVNKFIKEEIHQRGIKDK
jgi:hypothetical protein